MNDKSKPSTPFNFLWPTSMAGGWAMFLFLCTVGVVGFMSGANKEHLMRAEKCERDWGPTAMAAKLKLYNSPNRHPFMFHKKPEIPLECRYVNRPDQIYITIIAYYILPNVVGWFIAIMICKFTFFRIARSKSMRKIQSNRQDKKELEALRRRAEINRLKKELDEDDND